MNIEYLRYILEVADYGSFRGAAKALSIPETSLSYAVKKTEEKFGEPIFNKGRAGVSLTPFGKLALPYINQAISIIDQIPQEMSRREAKENP